MHAIRALPPCGWRRVRIAACAAAAFVTAAASQHAAAAPDVIATTPLTEAVGVSRSGSIRVVFAAPLDPATVVPANVLVTSSLQGTHAVELTWDPFDFELEIDPDVNFLPGERVSVTLGKGLRDLFGQSMPNGWHFEFSTWTAQTPPGGFVASPSTWSIGSIAFNLSIADLSGDGFPEVIFSNVVPDSLRILAADGAGGFVPFAAIARPDATLPRHVAVGDLDADGRADLVVCASGPSRVEVIRNLDEAGSFAAPVLYPTGTTPYGAYLGDLDADGDLDVATADFNGHTVSVLRNTGGGALGAAVSWSAGPTANSPRWVDGADLDFDGDVDLVCCNGYSFDVSVLLNDGTGGFPATAAQYPVDDSPQFCAVRDFTGDGIPDVVTLNSVGESVSLLRGNGDGTFQPRVDATVQGQLPYGLHVVDLDGDRDLDLVIPIRGVSAWQPIWNDGSGGFTAGELHFGGNHCHTIGAADWDGDGDIDVVAGFAISKTMNYYSHELVPSVTSSNPGANAGGLAVDAPLELMFNVDLAPASVTPAAFSVSGRVSGHHPVTALWSGAERKVTLQPQGTFSPGEIVTLVVVEDALVSAAGLPYPGDTRQFLTAGPAEPSAFAPPQTASLGATDPTDVVAADLDGDGLGDLAVCGFSSGDVRILMSSGLPVTAVTDTVPVGAGPVGMIAADLNADGHTDLLVASVTSSTLTPLLNVGGVLSPAAPIAPGGIPYALEGADLDRDGDLDLAVALLEPASIVVLRNDGGGSFGLAATLPLATPPLDVAVADLERDGGLELIAVLPLADELRVFDRMDGLEFMPSATIPAPDIPVGVLPWDVDGDGWVDLTVASYGAGGLAWLPNSGDGSFGPAIQLAEAGLPRGPWGSDVNGDGRLDLLTLGSDDGTATFLRNDGGGDFLVSTWNSPGPSPYAAATADLDGDGRVDFVVLDRAGAALTMIRGIEATGAPEVAGAAPAGLLGAWPNPFRDVLRLRLGIPVEAGTVRLGVFDVGGRMVARLHEGPWAPGAHEVRWDGRDGAGRRVASGVYFVRLETRADRWTSKVLHLR